MSNEEIAAHLYISVDTVKKSVSQLYRKFDVNNRLELLQRIYLPQRHRIPPKG
ncbi:response regulator transcription factor [Thermospira aquatica]|nr:helix-turn-helix transcriptional regulator [Thermospira aquatica]